MSSKIHLNVPNTTLQQTAMHQRMQKLGIELKDGVVDQNKLGQLRAGELEGADALRSVLGADGTLDAGGMAKLERGGSFASVFLGRSATISEKSTNEARAVTMALSGAIGSMSAVAKRGTVNTSEIERIGRQLEHAAGEYMKLVDGGKLGEVSPKAVDQLVQKFGELEGAISNFTQVTSQVRERLAEQASQGSVATKVLVGVALGSVVQADDTLSRLQQMARVLTTNLIPRDAPAAKPIASMSSVIGEGAIGVGARMYDRLAQDATSGLLGQADVQKVSGRLQTLSHETELPPTALADGIGSLLAAHFLGSRAASAHLVTLAVEGRTDPKARVQANGDAFLAIVERAARAHPGDEAKFTAAVREYHARDKYDAVVAELAARPAAGEISTPRAASGALVDAMHGLDEAFRALHSGDVARFEAILPQAREWVGEARAGVAQSVHGDEPAPQSDVTRLQIAFDHLRHGRELSAWGAAFGPLLGADGAINGTTQQLSTHLTLPAAVASRVQDDAALSARVQGHLRGMLVDLGALLKMSKGVDGLTGVAA